MAAYRRVYVGLRVYAQRVQKYTKSNTKCKEKAMTYTTHRVN